MEQTLNKYRKAIEGNRINPHILYDGISSGIIVDPRDDSVPVDLIGFGACQLKGAPISLESEDREMGFVPVEGRLRLAVGRSTFELQREGGPFARLPGSSNASAVYVPPGEKIRLDGQGEIIFYSAPAISGKAPRKIDVGEAGFRSVGAGSWRRDITILLTPEDVSGNLTVGETYSPPGLWSGTPLHVHDKRDPDNGQSDHEEVYYHRFRLRKDGRFGPYGIQLLFNGEDLNKAYVIRDRSVIAVPGASHPVIAGPVSDLNYFWGLAGDGSRLMMYDIPEFSYLKIIERILAELERKRGTREVRRENLSEQKELESFSSYQWGMLEMILRERGFMLLR
jgi:5-deoxy-D-glucuronate isomerase